MEKQNDTWKNVICSDVKLCATTQPESTAYTRCEYRTRVCI